MTRWLQRLERERPGRFYLLRAGLDAVLIFLTIATLYYAVLAGWLR